MNRDKLFLNAAVNLHVAFCRIVRAELAAAYLPVRQTLKSEYRCIQEQLGYSDSLLSSEVIRLSREKIGMEIRGAQNRGI